MIGIFDSGIGGLPIARAIRDLDSTGDLLYFGVVAMVGPTVQALNQKQSGRIVVVATPTTVRSGMYEQGFAYVGLKVSMIACPDLARAIEFGDSKAEIQRQVERAVEEVLLRGCDTLVLGCTHYPFARSFFEQAFIKHECRVEIFDPAQAVASYTLSRYSEKGEGKIRFLVSKYSPIFEQRV